MLSDKPVFIGLAGTLNAGKDSLGERLEQRHGFLHMSTSDMIREMKRNVFGDSPKALLRRNDPYINKLRAERGPGFLIEEVYKKWNEQKEKYPGGFVASAMRTVGEAEVIRRLDGVIVFVDAEPRIRYQRSQLRLRDANEQGKTFEEFMETERSEIEVDSSDKTVQNLGAMKDMADLLIENNGDDIAAFQDQAAAQLKAFIK